MLLTAKVLRWSLGLFYVNVLLVGIVSTLTRAGDDQPPSASPDVEVPVTTSDPPSLPIAKVAAPEANSSEANAEKTLPTAPLDLPPSSAPTAPVANNPVLDEIRKAIREGDESLQVPALEFPPLTPVLSSQGDKSGGATAATDANIKRAGKRVSSVKQLALAADALMAEAQLLMSEGKASEAAALLVYVRSLQAITSELSNKASNY